MAFSSEGGYNSTESSASAIFGPPDVYPRYGPDDLAWMPYTITGDPNGSLATEWLELSIDRAVRVAKIEIFETNGPAACVKIQLKANAADPWTTVWAGNKTEQLVAHNGSRTGARIFAPPIQPQALGYNKTRFMRLEFDMQRVDGGGVGSGTGSVSSLCPNDDCSAMYQIDAVRITEADQDGWVEKVLGFRTQFSPTDLSAKEALGEPDVYPIFGLSSEAWTHRVMNRGAEYLELGLRSSQVVSGVEVYETNAPGHLVTISLQKPDGSWDAVWKGAQQKDLPQSARIFAPALAPRFYKTQGIRLDINTNGLMDWYQIDAVRVVPRRTQWVRNVTTSLGSGEDLVGPPDGNSALVSPGSTEWMELVFHEEVYVASVAIYEVQIFKSQQNIHCILQI